MGGDQRCLVDAVDDPIGKIPVEHMPVLGAQFRKIAPEAPPILLEGERFGKLNINPPIALLEKAPGTYQLADILLHFSFTAELGQVGFLLRIRS